MQAEEGELIAGPSDSTQEKKVEDAIRVINDRTVKKNLVKDGRVHIAYYYDKEKGDDLSLFYTNIKGAPHWQIAVVCYDDEVYGALIELRIRLLLISLLVFVILLFIIGLFARNEEKLEWKTMQEERAEAAQTINRDNSTHRLRRLNLENGAGNHSILQQKKILVHAGSILPTRTSKKASKYLIQDY